MKLNTNLSSYIGTWVPFKQEHRKPNQHCYDKIIIKSIGKDSLSLTILRKNVRKKYIFRKNQSTQGEYKIEYKKEDFPELDESHVVKVIYNSMIVNGNLSASLLWSSSVIKSPIAGIKVFSVTERGTLIADRLGSGYVNESGINVDSNDIQTVFFNHQNNYSLNASGFSCQFKKEEKDKVGTKKSFPDRN